MGNLEDFNSLKEKIESIENDQIRAQNIPLYVYLQEAENLNKWLQPDKELLINAGVFAELIEEFPIRAGACREAQSLWIKEKNSKSEYEKEWAEKSPEAYDLRNKLLHAFTYAYRKDTELLKRVAEIRDGDGHADMIQDLNDLAVFGIANPTQLELINFPLTDLDLAADKASYMAELLAMANGDKHHENEAKLIRDKAYTYLKEAVDEIKACGKYLFWKDKDKLKGYASDFLRNQKK